LGDDGVVPTFVLVYLGGWALTALSSYFAARRWADRSATPLRSACFSVLGGAVWPLVLIGAAQIGALAAYAKVQARRRQREVAEAWPRADALDDVVEPLR